MLLNNSQLKGFNRVLQPASAWMAILALVLFSALCLLLHAGSILRIAFPVGSFAVGILLYSRYPILYVGFTWWLWFLTAWVRRIVDYQSGWVEPNPVLLAPYLVTFITIITFWRHIPKLYRQDGLPFLLSCTAVFYGSLVGLVNSKFGYYSRLTQSLVQGVNLDHTPSDVMLSILEWLAPILFGFHLFVNWRHYEEYRQNMQRTFYWSVLITGTYGVVQYLVAPEWDRVWLRNLKAIGVTTFGNPEPLEIRVFSTLHSNGPFAHLMMAGLLLLLTNEGILRFFAAAVGYLSLLLSLVRTAWGGWFLGLLIFISSLKPQLQMRLIITVLVVGMCVFPLATVEPFSTVINARLQTLSNVQEDGSYQARTATYNRELGFALSQPLGSGLGMPGTDSAIIDVFVALGWLGVIPYFGGIVLLLFKLLQGSKRHFDSFLRTTSAITISTLAMVVVGNVLIAFSGVIFWSFLAITIAGHKYYQYQLPHQT